MNAAELAHVFTSEPWRRRRTALIRTTDGPVVVKGQRPARGRWADHVLRALSGVLGLPLHNSPVPGGPVSQDIEVRRLGELHAAGVRVPRVLHVEREFFVMEYLPGRNLAGVLSEEPTLPVWEKGLHFILHVHRRGQYLSQAYARNFIAGPGVLGAIDFEDDPLEVMPLAHAQARDWLMYLHSTLWLLQSESEARLLPLWKHFVDAERGAVVEVLVKAARRLGWLRHLPRTRRPWGREVVSVQGVTGFMNAWARTRSAP